jgi:outer membrane beta-barrel protein
MKSEWRLTSAALAVACLLPATAVAQIRPAGSQPIEESEAIEAAAGDDGRAAPITATRDLGAPANKVREPGDDESVYVVQKRAYSKSGRFEITPIFMTAVNPKFVGYMGAAIAFAYHIQENLSIEFLTSIYQYSFYSDLVFEVWRYEDLTPEEVDLKQMLYFNALSLQFSALYGKLEFYGYLVDYDFYVTGGIGYALTREPCFPVTAEEAAAGDTSCSEVVDVGRGLRFPDRGLDAHKLAGNLGLGMRVFFHEMIGARVEFRDIVYSDRKVETVQSASIGQTTTDIRNTMMIILGLSIML